MNSSPAKVTFLFPVFNDFESLEIMIDQIDKEASIHKKVMKIDFLIVNDGSDLISSNLFVKKYARKINLVILNTDMRSGSQKTILVGLRYLKSINSKSHLIVLDSDGEDRAIDAVVLAKKLVDKESDSIIQAQRGFRKSGLFFQIAYFLYKKVFRILVGKASPPGNFMAIPNSRIENMLDYPGMEKHIAASIMRYSPRTEYVKFNRGRRLQGNSKMNFSSLIVHANGSLSVFADVVFTRVVIGIFTILSLLTLTGSTLFLFKILNVIPAIPGWTSITLLVVFSSIFIVGTNVVLLLLLMAKLEK